MRVDLGERCRLLLEVKNGNLSIETATEMLGLSQRQVQRVWQRYCSEGPGGLLHRNCGRPSNRSYSNAVRRRVYELYRTSCRGLGPTDFARRLEQDCIQINHETLRRWLASWNEWHEQRRAESSKRADSGKAGFGSSLLLLSIDDCGGDASELPWWLTILRDEAVGTLLFSCSEEVSGESALELVRLWTRRFGIPAGIRCRTSLLHDRRESLTIEQQLNGDGGETPFARALDRLGIEARQLTPASECCNLRRMEALFRAVRDAIEDAGPDSCEEATALLQGGLGDSLNRRFARDPAGFANHHVPVGDDTDLDRAFDPRGRRVAKTAGRDGRRLLRLVAV